MTVGTESTDCSRFTSNVAGPISWQSEPRSSSVATICQVELASLCFRQTEYDRIDAFDESAFRGGGLAIESLVLIR